jgi:hypothetical protein
MIIVCFHRGEIHSDDVASRLRVLARQGPPVDFRYLKNLSAALPLPNATKLTLSHSLSLVILDAVAGHHLFHLLADNALPLAWHLMINPSQNVSFLRALRRSIVFTTSPSQRHQVGKCKACVGIAEMFSPRVHYAHVDDDNVQCYCGGYFSSSVFLPFHAEMFKNVERSQSMRWLQSVLAARYGLPEYTGRGDNLVAPAQCLYETHSDPPSNLSSSVPKQESGNGLATAGGQDAHPLPPVRTFFRMNGKPRLLLIQRKRRSIGPIMEIFEAAENMGFDVVFTFFDSLPLRSQFCLARFADVLLSIHGMAMTWGFAMDGTTMASRGCRTVIELRHFVRPFPLIMQFSRHIASSANLSHVEIEATGCRFGPTVRSPAKERTRLLGHSFPIGLKGFHDQVAFYNVSEVKQAMQAAFVRAKSCPTT